MNAVNVAFTLVPRINATGRMSHADRAVTLLVSEDPEEAQSLAQDICEYNDQRKKRKWKSSGKWASSSAGNRTAF